MRSCEPLTSIPLCSPLYGNVTFPNPRGHQSQVEANEELMDWQILVDGGCSLYLRHFLCAYYAPFCATVLPLDLQVRPCRELCDHVRNGCEPLMNKHGTPWPAHLDCQYFPEKITEPWCFGPDDPSQLADDQFVTVESYEPLPSLSQASSASFNMGHASSLSVTNVSSSEDGLSATAQHFTPTTMQLLQSVIDVPSSAPSATLAAKHSVVQPFSVSTSADVMPTSTIKATTGISTNVLPIACTVQVNDSQSAVSSVTTSTGTISDSQTLNLSDSFSFDITSSHTMSTAKGDVSSYYKEVTSLPHDTTASTAKWDMSSYYKNITSSLHDTMSTTKGDVTSHYHSTSLPHNPPSPSGAVVKSLTSLLHVLSQGSTVSIPAVDTATTAHSKDTEGDVTTSLSANPATHSMAVSTIEPLVTALPTLGTPPATAAQSTQEDAIPTASHPTIYCQQMSKGGLCQGLGYSNISLPNLRGHTTKEEAESELDQFSLVIQLNCSPQLRAFLCFYYLPNCSLVPPYTLLPCRELCHEVKDDCSPLLATYKLVWPAHMICQHLPSVNTSSCSLPDESPHSLDLVTPTMAGSKARIVISPAIILWCIFVVALAVRLLKS